MMKKTISIVLMLCLVLSCVVPASALTVAGKPENGTTVGQPFAPGTGGSTNFRIPGIVTLADGTVIATIDARWSWAADAGGIDSIVSVSKDNGENWTYTFANFLGDNGNVANNRSCCFIDPAIGTNGTTAYMIADLYPAGFAINSARYLAQPGSTGFDANGNLILRSDAEQGLTFGDNGYETGAKNANYGYYLKDGKIYTTEDVVIEDYTVDAYFNIVGNGVNTNLFFEDSPYKPFPTDFLYMTSTTDGLNWSEPQLLDVKAAPEQSYLVGPGNGAYDPASGRMVFTAYRHTGGASGTAYECTSLIWMDAQGNWKRSEDCTVNNWSSEASSVVLDDGTVRVFYRDGFSYLRYTDMIWNEAQQNYVRDPDATEVATSAPKKSGCQLTAIKYSQPIDGKDAIIVATPANSAGRNDGHIYVFLANEDNSMDLVYDYDITPDTNEYYAYSCITELNNGDLGLLWESAGSAATYSYIAIDDVTARENNVNLTFKTIDIYTEETASFTDNTGNYENADVSGLDTDVATVEIKGETVVSNVAQTLGTNSNVMLEDCLFTFTVSGNNYIVSNELSDGNVVYLNHFASSSSNIPLTTGSNTVAITAGSGDQTGMFKLVSQFVAGGSGNARSLHFHMEAGNPYWNRCGEDSSVKCHEYLYRPAAEGETASAEIPGFVRITTVADIKDGGQYLIAAKNDAGNWYVLNPTTSSDSMEYVAKVVGQSSVSSSEITFTGVGAGETEVQIGNTIYLIKITELVHKDVTIAIGETVTIADETGYYVDADTSALDESIATVEIIGNATEFELSASDAVSSIESGKKFLIVNSRATKPMTNGSASSAAAAGAGSGLSLNGSKNNIVDAAVWTIEGSGNSYTVKDADGKYLSVTNNGASVGDSAVTLNIARNGNTWTISYNGAYLNDFGGGGTCAAGWNGSGANTDSGSQWDIHEVISTPVNGTSEIVFTGVTEGTTEVQIGDVVYSIIVTEETTPEETTPGETTPEETTPGETTPEESEPDETDPKETYPDEEDPDETDPVETQPIETQPIETQPQETTPEETKPEDEKPTVPECDKDDNCVLSEFADIDVNEWYHDGIHFCVKEGIMNGMGEGKFAPTENTTRAQLVTMLYRLAGEPSVEGKEEPFTDVSSDDWFYASIVWAYENKVVNGVTATEFAPNANVTREQVATILHRYLGAPEGTGDLSAFPDAADVSEYAVAPMTWAVGEGLINGIAQADGTSLLTPAGNATRAQIATILMRHLTAE